MIRERHVKWHKLLIYTCEAMHTYLLTIDSWDIPEEIAKQVKYYMRAKKDVSRTRRLLCSAVRRYLKENSNV